MLAPVSLIVFAIVFLFVVVASLDGGSESVESDRPQREASTPRPARTTESSPRSEESRAYVVESGDTLATIAEKTGVPVEQLQALNPTLDPRGLVTGQRIKLRE